MLRGMNSRQRLLPLLLAGLLAGGCATFGGSGGESGGGARFVVPKQLSEVYSEVELRTMLAVAPDAACTGTECDVAAAFRDRAARLGDRLAQAARESMPEGAAALPEFVLLVPRADEIGSVSSASGTIVLFEGTRALDFDETVLAFVIAREMGHVLAGHHDENSARQIVISVVVTLAMPMLNVLRGVAATLSTATTVTGTTLAATAASTVASMAGGRIVKAIYRPDQLREADLIALRLMAQAGWSPAEIADALHHVAGRLRDEGWGREMLGSKQRLDSLTAGPPWLLPSILTDATPLRSAIAID